MLTFRRRTLKKIYIILALFLSLSIGQEDYFEITTKPENFGETIKQLEENINCIDINLTDEMLNEIEDIHLSDPNPCV